MSKPHPSVLDRSSLVSSGSWRPPGTRVPTPQFPDIGTLSRGTETGGGPLEKWKLDEQNLETLLGTLRQTPLPFPLRSALELAQLRLLER